MKGLLLVLYIALHPLKIAWAWISQQYAHLRFHTGPFAYVVVAVVTPLIAFALFHRLRKRNIVVVAITALNLLAYVAFDLNTTKTGVDGVRYEDWPHSPRPIISFDNDSKPYKPYGVTTGFYPNGGALYSGKRIGLRWKTPIEFYAPDGDSIGTLTLQDSGKTSGTITDIQEPVDGCHQFIPAYWGRFAHFPVQDLGGSQVSARWVVNACFYRGQIDGTYLERSFDGKPLGQWEFRNGIPVDGERVCLWPNGQVRLKIQYGNGKVLKRTETREDGTQERSETGMERSIASTGQTCAPKTGSLRRIGSSPGVARTTGLAIHSLSSCTRADP